MAHTSILRSSSSRPIHHARLSVQLLLSFCSFWIASNSFRAKLRGSFGKRASETSAQPWGTTREQHEAHPSCSDTPWPGSSYLAVGRGDLHRDWGGVLFQPGHQEGVAWSSRLECDQGQHTHSHP